MLFYFQFKNYFSFWDQIFLDQDFSIDLIFSQNFIPCILKDNGFVIESLDTWSEIFTYLSSGLGLFEDKVSNIYFFDVKDLSFDANALKLLEQIQKEFSNLEIFLYSSTQEKLKVNDKKNLKKAKVKLKEVKKVDPNFLQKLAKKYLQILQNEGSKITSEDLKIALKESENSKELLDKIDFLDFSDDLSLARKSLTSDFDKPIFMWTFDLNNLQRDLGRWAKKLKEDEIQLALSLVLNKLKKQNHPYQAVAIQNLIQTDFKIKSSNKISSLVYWKSFLFETSKNLNSFYA